MADVDQLSMDRSEPRAPLGEERLFAFYDRVRARIESRFERRAGRVGRGVAQVLLLAPDLLLLLIRLFLDPEVPRSSRMMIGGALAYFLLPADLAPELVLGPVGFVDDMIVASTVLAHALGPELEVHAARYWSGAGDLRKTLQDVSRVSSQVLGSDLSKRVDRVVERRLLKKGPSSRASS